MRFHKMHGLGNDFVVIDGREAGVAIDSAAARAIADRRTGVGCDQLILIGPSEAADLTMRIWNADGGEVSACGNATRCVAALVGRDCTIETAAGRLSASLDGSDVAVDLGEPAFAWNAIPLAYAMDTLALPLAWGELGEPGAVNVGNPHLVFFVDDADGPALDDWGGTIETDPLFPERININVATIVDRATIRMRTWERGVGLTRACGTGASATAVAAIRRRLVDESVTVHMPGGTLRIDWAPGGSIRMTGPATHVFTGELDDTLLGAAA